MTRIHMGVHRQTEREGDLLGWLSCPSWCRRGSGWVREHFVDIAACWLARFAWGTVVCIAWICPGVEGRHEQDRQTDNRQRGQLHSFGFCDFETCIVVW